VLADLNFDRQGRGKISALHRIAQAPINDGMRQSEKKIARHLDAHMTKRFGSFWADALKPAQIAEERK
jgi:hypothetical protein